MLELQHLCKRYVPEPGEPGAPVSPSRATAVGWRWLAHDLSLQVSPGQTVALLGRSGSGKSTLLKMVAGLEAPESGRILFNGEDLTHCPPERRGFALMFQDFALFPHLDVQDNVAFSLIERRVPKAQARAQAVDMLARLGLADRARSAVGVLSGGEQQRVALARALVSAPRLLLLDEPFSALDADLRQRLREEFSQHITDAGMACLLVTHDETEARAMGRQGYRLVDGQLQPQW